MSPASPTAHDFPWQDPDLPVEQRLDDLLARLTLDEKIQRLMHESPAVDRVGLPAYNWWNECLHGVGRAGIATVFPQVIGLAATWDREMMHGVGTMIGDEARAKHHEALRAGDRGIYRGLTMWSPNINIFRDPRWGRGQETWGEDPLLTGTLASAFITGMQGDDEKYWKAAGIVKHYAVHSGPEPGRHAFDSRVDERDLRETYLEAFRMGVREANVAGVMSAYNRLNGVPCSTHARLLREILRGEWGFTGYVVSDVGAIVDVWKWHQAEPDQPTACARAVRAGCELNGGWEYWPSLREAVDRGLITESEIDDASRVLFRILFRLGLYDPPERVPFAATPIVLNDCDMHRGANREVAQCSMVLLQNDGTLPLRHRKGLRVAVIGPNADSERALVGNYHGTPSDPKTVLRGMREVAGADVVVAYAKGCELAVGAGDMIAIPAEVLRTSDDGTGEHGLAARYWSAFDHRGDIVLERTDANVNFNWGDQQPDIASFPTPHFSAEWTGSLVVPCAGTFRIGIAGNDDLWLYLDGQQVLEKRTLHGWEVKSKPFDFTEGQVVAVRLVYGRSSNVAAARLLWLPPDEDREQRDIDEAVRLARECDVAVVCVGLTADLEGEEGDSGGAKGFHGGDRTTLRLPGRQEDLVRAVAATETPVVLVVMSGSAIALGPIREHCGAIVQAWYPGGEGGAAVADVLFGHASPGGRLPVTFYRSEDDLPDFHDYRMENRTYRFFRGAVEWPFGFGLSYTHFEYADIGISPAAPQTGDDLVIRARITNVGAMVGDEVVQVYVSRLGAPDRVPVRSLAAFERVRLDPGESRDVVLAIPSRSLSRVTREGRRLVEPGAIEVSLGGMQPGFEATHPNPHTQVHCLRATLTGEVLEIEP